MAKAKQTPPAAPAVDPSNPPAAPAVDQGEASALRNVPFVGASNKVLSLVHADHGEAQVGDWQVEEFAALGWALK